MYKVCAMLSRNLLKVSQKDQDLVRCSSIHMPTLTLMENGRTVFQEKAQDVLQDQGANQLKLPGKG